MKRYSHSIAIRALDDSVTLTPGDCLDKSGGPVEAKARLEAAMEAVGAAPQASEAERAGIRERLGKLGSGDERLPQPSL